MKTRHTRLIAAILLAGLFGVAALNVGGIFATPVNAQNNSRATPQPTIDTAKGEPFVPKSAPEAASGDTKSSVAGTVEIIERLLLAVILSGILAFRPRKNVSIFKRSLFVSQTQILLAVVAAALMLIVGDNTARAFAIFAAVSLVRFRTNIRDPKEITVLLISLALGLAAGVGRWDLGIALCLFALALLWLLEFRESEQNYRSMELTVKTRNPDRTQDVLKRIFEKSKIDAEVRELVPVDADNPIGSITYYLSLRLNLTTDQLSDRILAADPTNTEGIQWSKSKNAADIYQ